MIVDLERNDLGRICRAGTVRVDERLRRGVVSLTHGWTAANVGRLTSVVDDVDPLTGMICQGAIPVTVRPS